MHLIYKWQFFDMMNHKCDVCFCFSFSLSISGKHLNPRKVSASELASRGDSPSDQTLAYLEEEIIESDGFIEEYLAYDGYQ